MKWRNDEPGEELLVSFDVPYERRKIALSQIDSKRSMSNKARAKPLFDETVAVYSRDMRNGSVFPELLVREVEREFVTIGGNHRVAAALANGETEAQALVVVCSDMEFDLLCKTHNRLNGREVSPAELIQQAADYSEAYDVPGRQVAAAFGLSHESLSSELRIRKLKRIAADNSCSCIGWSANAMSNLAKATPHIPAIVHILKKCRGAAPTCSELDTLKSMLADKQTEAQMMEAIETWSKARAFHTKQRAVKAPIRMALLAATSQLENKLMKAATISQTQMTMEEAKEVFRRLTETVSHLSRLLENGSHLPKKRSA